jgi:hypothetical protein
MRHFFIFFLILFTSCNSNYIKLDFRNGSNCEKDLESSKSVYIVNSSKDKTLKATLKTTINIDDTLTKYTTKYFKLLPGDEEELGCTETLSPQTYERKEVKQISSIQTSSEFDKLTKLGKLINEKKNHDTIIDGQKRTYWLNFVNDSTKPIKRIHTKYTYEVTAEYKKDKNDTE